MTTTVLWDLGERLVGEIDERVTGDNPFIQWCHESTTLGKNVKDEVSWCSSFVNRLAWCLRLPRSKSAAARSWLMVGKPVIEATAHPCSSDIVVLKRGTDHGAEVGNGNGGYGVGEYPPGHVGIFGGIVTHASGRRYVRVLGGNQKNNVSIAEFPFEDVLGIRRLSV